MDTSDSLQPGSGDVGFKPSLLDEILTEKKLVIKLFIDISKLQLIEHKSIIIMRII
jgi:hypothetical protein